MKQPKETTWEQAKEEAHHTTPVPDKTLHVRKTCPRNALDHIPRPGIPPEEQTHCVPTTVAQHPQHRARTVGPSQHTAIFGSNGRLVHVHNPLSWVRRVPQDLIRHLGRARDDPRIPRGRKVHTDRHQHQQHRRDGGEDGATRDPPSYQIRQAARAVRREERVKRPGEG